MVQVKTESLNELKYRGKQVFNYDRKKYISEQLTKTQKKNFSLLGRGLLSVFFCPGGTSVLDPKYIILFTVTLSTM